MSAQVWIIIVAVGIGTFALGAILVNLLQGVESRGRDREPTGGLLRRHEAEKEALETTIRHYELLISPESRAQAEREIAELQRRLAEAGPEPTPEREQQEAHLARLQAEVRAAGEIAAERERRLQEAIQAAGVTQDQAAAITSAASMEALLPLIGDTLRAGAEKAEAVQRQIQRAEQMKEQADDLQAEAVRLQMAADEAARAHEARADAMKQHMAQAEEIQRQLAELEAEANKLEEAKAEAMKRQEERAEALNAEQAKAEAMRQETEDLGAFEAFRDTLARRLHPALPAEEAPAAEEASAPDEQPAAEPPEGEQTEDEG